MKKVHPRRLWRQGVPSFPQRMIIVSASIALYDFPFGIIQGLFFLEEMGVSAVQKYSIMPFISG